MATIKKYNGSTWENTTARKYETKSEIITPPTTIYTDGTAITAYTLKGNTVQSGTPTPDSPVMPQGTGERTGNLFDFERLKNAPSGTIGSITFLHVLTLQLKANTYYTMASNGTGSTSSTPADLYRSVYFNSTTGESSVNKNNPVTVLTDNTGVVRIGFFSERTNAQQYLNGEAQLWINEGSTALPYEPYGIKIPISSANTTTPVYLGQVESTRRIGKLVLTGQERWYKSGAYQGSFYLGGVSPEPISLTEQAYCSHAEFTSISTYAKNKFCFNGSPINLNLWIGESSWTTDDFKAYLAQQYTAGTPVTVWYVLAEPTTGILNEPLRKIGSYADTVSGITIPTITGKDTFDVDTTLKPSEVELTYTGWHDASVGEWDGSQWQ